MHGTTAHLALDDQRLQRRIVYVAPPPGQIEKFAFAVCQRLSEKRGENYCDTATVREFTAFLKTVVNIKVKAKNAEVAHVQE